MTPADEWRKTSVHKASSYSCGKCGKQFPDPHAVYDHLDEVHPPPLRPKKKATR
jgi:hypothetical protein